MAQQTDAYNMHFGTGGSHDYLHVFQHNSLLLHCFIFEKKKASNSTAFTTVADISGGRRPYVSATLSRCVHAAKKARPVQALKSTIHIQCILLRSSVVISHMAELLVLSNRNHIGEIYLLKLKTSITSN